MESGLRDRFINLWNTHFPGAELPVTVEFREPTGDEEPIPGPDGWRCMICQLGRARKGKTAIFDARSITCAGGRTYAGFPHEPIPGFEYFLSYGKEGVVRGERYKKNPEIVNAWRANAPKMPLHGKEIVFRRFDTLTNADNPEIVIFFARGEVLSGLFTLANYDRSDPYGVICPMGAGCSSILLYPWTEQQKEDPKVVLGMFDPSARPCVPLDVMTMAFPMKRFVAMVGYMEESFLITEAWDAVKKKIARSDELHGTG